MKIEHVAMWVKDLEKAKISYKKLSLIEKRKGWIVDFKQS